MKNQIKEIGRLSFRQEGENWCAYYAQKETMEGAIFLGSIKCYFINSNSDVRDAFVSMMSQCVSDIIEDVTGIRPSWTGPRPAPEHEKSGNA